MALATKRKQEMRKVAEKQAVALLNLTPEQVEYVHELRDLFRKSNDEVERAEIRDAFIEVVYPEGIDEEGDLSAGITATTKRRVADYHSKVGKAIKRRRIEKGMTQAELADKAGIPQSHVSRLESGRHTPTHLTIRKLARALNTQARMLDPGFDI